MAYTAHVDTFARDHLPPPECWPQFRFESPELRLPERLNLVTELLDRWVMLGEGDRPCLVGEQQGRPFSWTYAELQQRVNRIARVLIEDLELVPGNRVLLHGANTPMLAACWLAVIKAGGIGVGTLAQLRERELRTVVDKARIGHALCDERAAAALRSLRPDGTGLLRHLLGFNGDAGSGSLEAAMQGKREHFDKVDTAATDTCVIAFTAGTSGMPKGTMHFHRDVIAACRCWPRHVLRPEAGDRFAGSASLAYTFGLGGLLMFPLSVGASTVLIEKASPELLLAAIAEHQVTICLATPSAYRAMAPLAGALRLDKLRKCASAGEALPPHTRERWKRATGIELIDGLGSSELFHIVLSAAEPQARPGAVGLPVPGYQVRVVDDQGHDVPPGQVGFLAVRGPTGCRLLADERQRHDVQQGWTLTGDACVIDDDGQFVHVARTDDLIVSNGISISGPEVEAALLAHPAVGDCAVVGASDELRGQVVSAHVVLRPPYRAGDELMLELQDFCRQQIAPYKAPRRVIFCEHLPRNHEGKLQRFLLRQL